ncbi:MAG: efflux RND transporter permease subunit [Spirochaetaceae bacterium]|jgi:multidrug efflux pump subunit AcrB|nr:efflux RND transporter permease subunit [Spirochaetaceae bacterium]
MKIKSNERLNRPVCAVCVAVIILAAAFVLALNAQNNFASNDLSAFAITIKHYGINAKEIERTIAMPLEDALYQIDNVKSVLTSSENGKASAYIQFKKSKNIFVSKENEGRYEAISEAAEKIYKQLPQSAQRPEISSSTENRRPVWTSSVFCESDNVLNDIQLSGIIERTIKPALKSINGIADVEVSGLGVTEIVIALKSKEALLNGINCDMLAEQLSANDILLPAGMIEENGKEVVVMMEGRYKNLSALKDAIVLNTQGKPVQLEDIANVAEKEREPDSYARLNGKKTIVISVYPNYNANLRKLSRELEKQLASFNQYPIKFEVLSDYGKEEIKSYNSVLFSAIQGAIFVTLITGLLVASKRNKNRFSIVICSLVIPYICLLSACILIILGFSPDKTLLAGLSAGIGAAVDTAIICYEQLNGCKTISESKEKLKQIRVPLISGSLTTIIALLPLIFTPFSTKEIIIIAVTIGIVNFVSLALALSLLPPLFLTGMYDDLVKKQHGHVFRPAQKIARMFRRKFLCCFNFCTRHPVCVILSALVITFFGVFCILISGTDTSSTESENSVYVQIEFKGGLNKEIVDTNLENWSKEILAIEGIVNIQSNANVGSGTAIVNYNPKIISTAGIKELLRATKVNNGFVYLPDSLGKDRIWNIRISGDSVDECKTIARLAGEKCSSLPFVQEVVLNFKDGSKNITFIPDRKRLSLNAINKNNYLIFHAFANSLRWSVHGPVAYKRLSASGTNNETDVRIRGLGFDVPTKDELSTIAVNTNIEDQNSVMTLDSVFMSKEDYEPSGIRREGRRRIASISIRTKANDARVIKKLVMPVLQKINIPQGYSIEFDHEAIEDAEALSKTTIYFFLSLCFCYMIIASVNESFKIPLLALSVIPVSAAVPAIFMTLFGYKLNTALACAFLSVCGIAVNASVLIVDSIVLYLKENKTVCYKRICYNGIRSRLPVLSATAATTIIAALPFVFLQENANAIIKVLSLVTALGVFVSLLCSIFLIPSILILFGKFFLGKGVLRSGT